MDRKRDKGIWVIIYNYVVWVIEDIWHLNRCVNTIPDSFGIFESDRKILVYPLQPLYGLQLLLLHNTHYINWRN